jgi:2-iminobutanoate/2-iminopropanoate deaminase
MAPSGRTVYLSGQIPLDPETGALVTGDIRSQTHRVMANLQAVLSEAGLGFGDVVFTTIFLANLNDFQSVNEVYKGYFETGSVQPARATVEVARLPRDVALEISCVAVLAY